jgi:ABC-2 type transport system ATP-binding protein
VEATLAGAAGAGPFDGARLVSREGDRSTWSFETEAAADAAVKSVVGAGGRVAALTAHRETLEDFFMRRLAGATEASAPATRASSLPHPGPLPR